MLGQRPEAVGRGPVGDVLGPDGQRAVDGPEVAGPAHVELAEPTRAPARGDVVGVADHRGALHVAHAALVEPRRAGDPVLVLGQVVGLGVERVAHQPTRHVPGAVLAGHQLWRPGATVEGEEGVAHLLGAAGGLRVVGEPHREGVAVAERALAGRHLDDVVDLAGEQTAAGAGDVHTSPPACTPSGSRTTRPRPSRCGTTSRTWRYSRVSTSTTVIRLPSLRPPRCAAYQLVSRRRRPSTFSSSLASAEVVMPWGYHRSVPTSASFQRKPHSTARPATSVRVARRFRCSRTPARPTRRPKRSTAASMSAAFSSVRRRWIVARRSSVTPTNVDG